MRYKLKIKYNGSNYIGWQKQKNYFPSIQECLNKAFHLFCGHSVLVYGSGRTDSGVHAVSQFAHVDLIKNWSVDIICSAVNYYLRSSYIFVLSARKTSIMFHARFSAIKRHYIYRLINKRSYTLFPYRFAWYISFSLDINYMKKISRLFLGTHNFVSLKSTACSSFSNIKTLDRFDLVYKNNEIKIFISSKSFLYHQVRNMVGLLILTGKGKISFEDFINTLNNKEFYTKLTAPSYGLYLNSVDYFNSNIY